MGMKICVIGNSHLAALKAGWEDIRAEYPHIDVTWFDAKSRQLAGLEVRGGALVPMRDDLREMMQYTSAGKDRIEAGYDCYFVVGCELSFYKLVLLVQESEGIADAEAVSGTSRAAMIAYQLRKITDGPVAVLPVPYSSQLAAEDAYGWTGGEEALVNLDVLYRGTLRDLGREHGFKPLLQPERTIRNTVFTKVQFRLGGDTLQLKKASGRNDGLHMNARFGAMYLLEALDAFSGVRSN
jgi:hypothetical protein